MARLFSNFWCGSSSKTLRKSTFFMSSNCSLSTCLSMHSENPQAEVVRLSIAETMLTPFQQPVLHIVHVSLDLFLYYRWYHIIREGKQTHWSAVSRIIPTALFVDGKGIFSSLLAQYQLVIIENTIWSGGLKFYI